MQERMLSVIVPVYDVEQYLVQCLHSILRQSYNNLEILLIDDGSTDSSGEICEKCASNDPRISVFHKTNGGQSTARNLGLDKVRGDYIAFVDSDDMLENGMFSAMVEALEDTDADIAACAFFNCSEEGKEASGAGGKIYCWTPDEIFLNKDRVRFFVWNKIYRRETIGTTRFIPGQVYEEVHFNHLTFLSARKLVYIESPYYDYRISRAGNTNSTFKPGRMCIFKEFDSLQQDLEEHGYLASKNAMIRYALEFYRRLYREAWELNAGKEVRRLIYMNFKLNFQRAKKSKLCMGKKLLLFTCAPNLLSFYDVWKGKVCNAKKRKTNNRIDTPCG